jgi:hypothetical protein
MMRDGVVGRLGGLSGGNLGWLADSFWSGLDTTEIYRYNAEEKKPSQ